MIINSERHFDADLKAFYDDGNDVSYGGETLSFTEAGRTLVFQMDDLTPNYATFSKAIVDGVPQQARSSQVFPDSGAFQVTQDDLLLVQSLRFLSVERSVQCINLYDGPSGGYKRVAITDFL